jgi:aminocarboxymuconate-semialdehyde decarboxylase
MKIEVHAHLILSGLMGQAGTYGPEMEIDDQGRSLLRVGAVTTPTTTRELQEAVLKDPGRAREIGAEWQARVSDPALRVAEMDSIGVDVTLVSISPLLYLYWAEPEIGARFSRAANESMAAYCAPYPDRLFFMATLPMQDPPAALSELTRAVDELGARCINIAGGDLAGRELDDPAFYPIYEFAAGRGIPLLVHPYPTTFTTGARHPLGLDYILEYCYQEAVAFATLIYGGVLDRFPGLQVGITHGGGFVPYQLGRLEVFAGPEGSRANKRVADYLDQFFFDILIHDLPARRFLLERMGPDRLVVGSNYGGIDSMNGFVLLDELALPREDYEKIAWRNAARLFGLEDLTPAAAAG